MFSWATFGNLHPSIFHIVAKILPKRSLQKRTGLLDRRRLNIVLWKVVYSLWIAIAIIFVKEQWSSLFAWTNAGNSPTYGLKRFLS